MSAWGRVACSVLVCAVLAATGTAAQPAIATGIGDAPLRQRVEFAAREVAALYADWLGPTGPFTFIIDRSPAGPGEVRLHPAWRSAPATMDVEIEVAFELARRQWRFAGAGAAAVTDGASWYLQSRAIARVFDLVFEHDGHSVDSIRVFGGHYPIAFPQLRLDGPGAGLGRSLLGAGTHGRRTPRYPAGVTTAVVRVAHAFGSLERIAGWPRLAGALRVLASARVASTADAVQVIGGALGQDVSWLFAPVLEPLPVWSYAVDSIAVESCEPQPCVRTRVNVTRLGSATFAGRREPRTGPFDSGDALQVRVGFADGQSATAHWDGRDQARAFTFEAPAAPVEARLDPASMMLVDDNWLDQARRVNGATNVPVTKWVSRWLIWLQQAMLAYSGIV